MNKIAIISDSSCNLNSKLKEEFGVDYIVPMHFILDGKMYNASGDWEVMSAKDYYDNMRNGKILKSSLIKQNEYEEAFKLFLDKGYDILSISCTSALSSSVRESYKAKDALKALYPNQIIECVDSANCTFSLAMILKEASKMREEGKSISQIVNWIDENKLYFNEVGTVDKLTYLRLAGRISASAAFFGGMLGVKPIVVYDLEGHNVAVQKVKGRKKSLETVADYIKKYAIVDKYNTIYIAHADCIEDAKLLSQMIQDRFEEKLEFVFDYVESGVGSSVGPGTLILGFYGNKAIRMLNK